MKLQFFLPIRQIIKAILFLHKNNLSCENNINFHNVKVKIELNSIKIQISNFFFQIFFTKNQNVNFSLKCKNFIQLNEEKRVSDINDFGLFVRKILQQKHNFPRIKR